MTGFAMTDADGLASAARAALDGGARAMSRDGLDSPTWIEREHARRAALEAAGYAAFMTAAGEPRAYSLVRRDLAPEEAAYAAFAGSMGIVAPASVRRSR